jgi:hypothetical protein
MTGRRRLERVHDASTGVVAYVQILRSIGACQT